MRRVRTEPKVLRGVTGPEQGDGIPLASWRPRHLGERAAVRPPEAERAIGLAARLIALLVNGAVMATAEKGEIRQRGGASLCPMVEMMPLGDTHAAARETAAPVPMLQRPPQGGRNGPRPRADFHDAPSFVLAHHHPARVTRLGCTPKVRHGN